MSNKRGIDGIVRSEENEAKLNSLFAAVFSGADGEQVLAHLKKITINRINGPEVTNDVLRHVEGQRHLVGLIDARVRAGQNKE